MKIISREFADAVRRAFMNSFGIELPDTELLLADDTDVILPSRVILYNDNDHTIDEVGFQLMMATACTLEKGRHLAFEVDAHGLACVFEGELGNCLEVSSILEEIALNTEVTF